MASNVEMFMIVGKKYLEDILIVVLCSLKIVVVCVGAASKENQF